MMSLKTYLYCGPSARWFENKGVKPEGGICGCGYGCWPGYAYSQGFCATAMACTNNAPIIAKNSMVEN